MKRWLIGAVLAVGVQGAALADVGAGLVGNTVVLTGPEGSTTHVFYRDTTTFVMLTPEGEERRGIWRVEGNRICTRIVKVSIENCTNPIKYAPVVGASGTLNGESGPVQWAVLGGKAF